MTDSTVAKIGRSMKNFEIILVLSVVKMQCQAVRRLRAVSFFLFASTAGVAGAPSDGMGMLSFLTFMPGRPAASCR